MWEGRGGYIQLDCESMFPQVQEYKDDPLIYHGSLRARWGAEAVEAIKTIRPRVGEIRLPMFVIHSRADRLAPFTGSTYVLDNLSSEDKTFEVSQI